MCGIVGLLVSIDSIAKPGIQYCINAMLDAIKHRGPDDWGIVLFGFEQGSQLRNSEHIKWIKSPGMRLVLGHRRLSILDLSPAGRQPMLSHDGRFCITFNGEIYNYIELRSILSKYCDFRTRTDTEVLLEAYRQWGIEMLEYLDGMFAFALWDTQTKKLICARDPMGIKPFYFAKRDGLFFFASEPRAVLAGLDLPGSVDATRVAEFLVYGVSDHDEGTSYREVQQLRGGYWFEIDATGVVSKPRAFWKPPDDVIEEKIDAPALVREHIEFAICRQLRSDVRVGGCLSGGLDSGSVVASVSKILASHTESFTTLTLANKHFQDDESDLASAVAKRVGVNWEKVEPELEEVSKEIEDMARAMDEPFPSLSMLAQRKIMQRAHDLGIKVMLDGQGGDEVFLGYPRVAQRVLSEYLRDGSIVSALREWSGLKRHASLPLVRSLFGNLFFSFPFIIDWHNVNRAARLVELDFLKQIRPEILYQMYGSSNGVRGIQIAELTRFCLPQLLRFEDRNSMAYGVEARVPLLSVSLVELGLRLPLYWKVRNGWTKYALRVAMKNSLPDEVVWGPRKRGFEVPQKRWVEAARSYIAECLASLPQGCPIKGQQILAYIDTGRGGEQWLWRCISVALWINSSGVRV